MALAGGGPPLVVALVQINLNSVGKWAESQRIAYTTFTDLSQRSQVYDLVGNEIQSLNLHLPEFVRVRKFVCLPKELNAEEGELTHDGKLRKNFLKEKYRGLLEAVYSGKEAFSPKWETKSGPGITNISVAIRTLT
jgi:long-chain acyl-CoA synthetase